MAKVDRFEDLRCWQAARVLVNDVYRMSNDGIVSKDFDFRNQIRRAALSTMNNIAEGFGRYSKKDFTRFLEISLTSANEVKSLLYIAIDLQYLTLAKAIKKKEKAEGLKSMNLALIKYLNSRK